MYGVAFEWGSSNRAYQTRECKLFRSVGEIDVSCVLVFIANEYEIGPVKLIDARIRLRGVFIGGFCHHRLPVKMSDAFAFIGEDYFLQVDVGIAYARICGAPIVLPLIDNRVGKLGALRERVEENETSHDEK